MGVETGPTDVSVELDLDANMLKLLAFWEAHMHQPSNRIFALEQVCWLDLSVVVLDVDTEKFILVLELYVDVAC